MASQKSLGDAAYAGNVEDVTRLIASGANVNEREKFTKITPLHFAAGEGHTNIVDILIKAGANVNTKARHGETALYQAIMENHTETIKHLLEAGADPNIVGDIDYDNTSPLMMAIVNNNVEAVTELLNHGADVNFRHAEPDVDGDTTALSTAVKKGNIDIVIQLILRGADPLTRDDDGRLELSKLSMPNLGRVLHMHHKIDIPQFTAILQEADLPRDEATRLYMLRTLRERAWDRRKAMVTAWAKADPNRMPETRHGGGTRRRRRQSGTAADVKPSLHEKLKHSNDWIDSIV